jgi:hypothetical protein
MRRRGRRPFMSVGGCGVAQTVRCVVRKAMLVLPLLLFLWAPAHGNVVVLLQDPFDTENGGVGKLNYANFVNWTVSDGTVDLIGNGYYDFLPGNGLYVDMDGSTSNAGKMTSKTVFTFTPGVVYHLQFDLAGNQRNDSAETVTVQVVLGNVFSESFSLPRTAPFTTYVRTFTVSAPQSGTLTFEGAGGDNIGMLLDDVKLTAAIPVPGALGLGVLGLGLAAAVRRRIRG